MDLKDFVADTIVSIVEGIKEAQSKSSEMGAFVNPGGLMRERKSIKENSTWDNRNNNYVQPVEFDVAITAEDSASGGARVKVLSGILGGDMGGEKGSKNTVASRVQFMVPVLFPSVDIEDPRARNARVVKDNGPIPPSIA